VAPVVEIFSFTGAAPGEMDGAPRVADKPAGALFDDAPGMTTVKFAEALKPFRAVRLIELVPPLPGVRGRMVGEENSVKLGFADVGARALNVDGPFGLPHPVTKSKPVTALKPCKPLDRHPNVPGVQVKGGLLELGLLPEVMSWNTEA
jgi:hypothetical protein